YISLVLLAYLICITCGLDVKTEVGCVEYGESVTLKCTLLPPNTAVQVTWTRVVGDKETTISTYTDSRAEICKDYENRPCISTSRLNETAIKVYKTSLQDEGCYKCIFNSLHEGSKQGEVCLTIPGKVLIEKDYRVRLSLPVILKCILRENSNVQQITWQKNEENIATYNKQKEVYIDPKYQGVINVTAEGGLNVSSLTLSRARISDEGKYKCLFNIFPTGAATGETSLQVYEPLNGTIFKNEETGCLRITCIARSWPPSIISWLDVDERSLTSTTYDGLTVTSWILINSPENLQKKIPKCKIIYLKEESHFSLSTGTRCRLHPVILGLLVSIMFLL
ncbi:Immunoglobulin V-set domain, partial [Pristimantis euphronides]